eukprot:g2556.t1
MGDWEAAEAEDGQIYYYNSATNQTSWDAPLEAWERVLTEDGRPYFHNVLTNETAWKVDGLGNAPTITPEDEDGQAEEVAKQLEKENKAVDNKLSEEAFSNDELRRLCRSYVQSRRYDAEPKVARAARADLLIALGDGYSLSLAPPQEIEKVTVAAEEASEEGNDAFKTKILEFLKLYDPGKDENEIKILLEQYAGKEKLLLRKLGKKYIGKGKKIKGTHITLDGETTSKVTKANVKEDPKEEMQEFNNEKAANKDAAEIEPGTQTAKAEKCTSSFLDKNKPSPNEEKLTLGQDKPIEKPRGSNKGKGGMKKSSYGVSAQNTHMADSKNKGGRNHGNKSASPNSGNEIGTKPITRRLALKRTAKEKEAEMLAEKKKQEHKNKMVTLRLEHAKTRDRHELLNRRTMTMMKEERDLTVMIDGASERSTSKILSKEHTRKETKSIRIIIKEDKISNLKKQRHATLHKINTTVDSCPKVSRKIGEEKKIDANHPTEKDAKVKERQIKKKHDQRNERLAQQYRERQEKKLELEKKKQNDQAKKRKASQKQFVVKHTVDYTKRNIEMTNRRVQEKKKIHDQKRIDEAIETQKIEQTKKNRRDILAKRHREKLKILSLEKERPSERPRHADPELSLNRLDECMATKKVVRKPSKTGGVKPGFTIRCKHCATAFVDQASKMAHLLHCDYFPIPCNNFGCTVRIPRHLVDEHRNLCLKREVECFHGCGTKVVFEKMRRHIAKCPRRPLPCKLGCGKTVEAKNLQTHMLTECEERARKCLICGKRVRGKGNYNDHIQRCKNKSAAVTNDIFYSADAALTKQRAVAKATQESIRIRNRLHRSRHREILRAQRNKSASMIQTIWKTFISAKKSRHRCLDRLLRSSSTAPVFQGLRRQTLARVDKIRMNYDQIERIYQKIEEEKVLIETIPLGRRKDDVRLVVSNLKNKIEETKRHCRLISNERRILRRNAHRLRTTILECELAENRALEATEEMAGPMAGRDDVLETLRQQTQELYKGIKSEKYDATITEQMEIQFLTAELQRTNQSQTQLR